MHSMYFSNTVPCPGAPLPSAGADRMSFPDFIVLSKHYDSPPFIPRHFVAFAQWYHRFTPVLSLSQCNLGYGPCDDDAPQNQIIWEALFHVGHRGRAAVSLPVFAQGLQVELLH
ncbi:MAG: hypothetical protein Aurels2KO_50850 [Aureliella sp.]